MGEKVKLFVTWSSPFSLRVIWALRLKGIEYDIVHEDLSNKSSVLVHNDQVICESLVILEYVDETWKHNTLLPEDPYERATARFWARFGDDKVLASIVYGVFVKQGKEQEEGIVASLENLKHLEEELKGKKFFGGKKIGLVDLALGWLAYYLGIFEEIMGLKLVDQQKFPSLAAWIHEFADHPVIRDAWPPRDKLVAKFIAMRETHLSKDGHN
ncbi:hypothetical protein K2173_014355 [Erythroxylum novogranatense]|uniref:glutathione transferase n=1 Tax=Erythroxylum novogranatense TaxID=1862640 RepID=A0AAV8S691_9ROSI|nr:hypothetical protein K2173_014355 [Erythroxylum novogranatense]